MKRNEYLDKELERMKAGEKTEANWDVLRAYKETLENGNLWLNIHIISESGANIERIIETLKEAGIKEFTVSDNSTDAMNTLFELTIHGAKIEKFTIVYAPWHNIHEKWDNIPAAVLTIEEE